MIYLERMLHVKAEMRSGQVEINQMLRNVFFAVWMKTVRF